MYQLIVKPSAEKQLLALSKPIRLRVLRKLEAIEADPRARATKLAGATYTWRQRVGDYRIVYEIDDTKRTVFVTIIAHRREVYRGL